MDEHNETKNLYVPLKSQPIHDWVVLINCRYENAPLSPAFMFLASKQIKFFHIQKRAPRIYQSQRKSLDKLNRKNKVYPGYQL